MSPAKFHGDDDDEHSGRDIKGPRPSPLKINKGSHFIQKQSSSSSTSISSVLSDCVAPVRQQQRRPVIIYTHSPKIIHTQARDFMALVQKLTGVSRPNDDEATAQPDHHHHHHPHNSDKISLSMEGGNDRHMKPVSHDDNDSSSALTDENCGGGKASSSSLLPTLNQNQNQTNQYFADMPLFTPNSSSFFCSPRPVYRYPDSSFASPNVGNSMSPSVFEFLKGLPEY